MDVAIIGAGVIGLAIAAEISARVPRVVVFERHDGFGQETSSRNSEVVHAGLYYPTGWLKARLCVEGRQAIYDLADRIGIPYRRCGKLIVAVREDEVRSLEELMVRGQANGVEALRLLDATEVRSREPGVTAHAALHSPETGTLDSHALMATYHRQAREHGADVVLAAAVQHLDRERGAWRLIYRDASGEDAITARAVVNAAGLAAQEVMRMAGLDPDALGLTGYLCKGEYFAIQGARRTAVRSLVYPSPRADLAGLGIHTNPDLGGGTRLGPNAFYVEAIDYDVDRAHGAEFVDAVRPFLPWLATTDLAPALAGIRPKLAGPGEPARDFHIAHEAAAGAVGFFNLAGIESPGLTASPAIGRMVAGMVEAYLRES